MTQKNFGRLVKQYEKLVYSICYQLTQNHHTAEDLAQETFLSAYYHIDSCPEENYRPWFARIAANKAKDFLKSAYHRRVTAAEESEMPEILSEKDNPEELVVSEASSEKVKRMIWEMKEPYRQPAVLYFIEEQSVDEISRRLNRPGKTVYTQLARARTILQNQMGREKDHESVFE